MEVWTTQTIIDTQPLKLGRLDSQINMMLKNIIAA